MSIYIHIYICVCVFTINMNAAKQKPKYLVCNLFCSYIAHSPSFCYSPCRHVDGFYTEIATWLVQWLLFRFMFAAGIVKLTSHCNTWWSLTALNYHYESQVRVHVCTYKCMLNVCVFNACTLEYMSMSPCLISSICI